MNKQEVEERIQQFLTIRLKEEGTINAMMEMDIYAFDFEHQQVKLAFPVHRWQLNPAGHLHGGMICTALDITMGCAAYVFSQALFTPTIQMSVNFVKGITHHDDLIITGICDHAGSRMAQVRGIAKIQKDTIVTATSHGSYAINK